MRAFLWEERDSFLHRLNPLTKLAFSTLVILLLTAIVDPITPLVVGVLDFLALWRLGQISPRVLLKLLLPFFVLSFGLIWTTTLFYVAAPGTHAAVVWRVGSIVVTDQGLAYGLAIFFRLLAFFSASLIFVMTSNPTDVVQALVQRLRVSYRFGYGAHAAYRFVPLFQTELDTIRAAHRVRGVDEGKGLLGRYRRYVGYLIPLLAGGVRKAERVALAMDARGFGATTRRTYYRRSRFGIGDLVFAAGSLLTLGLVLFTLHQLGWLGQLVPPFIS